MMMPPDVLASATSSRSDTKDSIGSGRTMRWDPEVRSEGWLDTPDCGDSSIEDVRQDYMHGVGQYDVTPPGRGGIKPGCEGD